MYRVSTSTYYAVEIFEDGLWHKPANWRVDKKWIFDRVKQLRDQGHKVRVKEVKEWCEEKVIDEWEDKNEQQEKRIDG